VCVFFSLQNIKLEFILLVILLFIAIANGALLPSTSFNLPEVYLVRSLNYISHRYFAPGQFLAILSPDTYRDVQQELIAEIQRLLSWLSLLLLMVILAYQKYQTS